MPLDLLPLIVIFKKSLDGFGKIFTSQLAISYSLNPRVFNISGLSSFKSVKTLYSPGSKEIMEVPFI